MHQIINELPAAIRWSKILKVVLIVLSVLLAIGAVVMAMNNVFFGIILFMCAGFFFWQYRLFKNYVLACEEALASESVRDIEDACEKQAVIIRFYGILTLVMLVIMVIGLIAAFLLPMMAG